MKIGFDFDGTLAVWPRGFRPRFDDASSSMANAAAVLGAVKWLKSLIRQGHEVVIITGRGAIHQGPLRYWLFQFTGAFLEVITRPGTVGLDVQSQATWKAQVINQLDVEAYVGDNYQIDLEACVIVGIPFIDAKDLRQGQIPGGPVLKERKRG